MTLESVAAVAEVSIATVTNVMREYRESHPTLRHKDPLEIIDDMIEGYQADLAEFASVSNSTKNDAVRVGAINGRMGARDRIITLLQATGILPHDLGQLRVEIDVRYVAVRVLAVFDKYGLPQEAKEELLALLEADGETTIDSSAN